MTADQHDGDAVARVRHRSVRKLGLQTLVAAAVLIAVALAGVQVLRPAGAAAGRSTRSTAPEAAAASMPDLRAKAQQIADNMIASQPGGTVDGAAYVETTIVGWAGRNTGWIDNYDWAGAARTDIVLMIEVDGYFTDWGRGGPGPAAIAPAAIAMETDYDATKDFTMDSGMWGGPAWPGASASPGASFSMIKDHGTPHTLTVGPRPSPTDSAVAPG